MTTSDIQPEYKPPDSYYTSWQMFQFFLFWSWNLIFLAFMSLGFAPVMLPETLTAVLTGTIPGAYLGYALVLALIPVFCVILGLTVLRRAPGKLFALGYVIEGPLMLLLAVRFFLIRQATPGVSIALLIALLGMAAFLWTLLDTRKGERRLPYESLRLLGLTLMALTSLYAAVWIAFYALPAAAELLRALAGFIRELPRILGDISRDLVSILRNTPIMLPFSILGFLLLLYTATLFVLAPVAVPLLSLRAWWHSYTRQLKTAGRVSTLLLVGLSTAGVVGIFILSNRQPQARAFALLEQPPASTQEAKTLLRDSDVIREGLLNAYLAPFRYISARGEVRHIREMYHSAFNMPQPQAYRVQQMYESMAAPLLYQPVNNNLLTDLTDNRALVEEPRQAADLYQQFFDTPIVDGERQTIVAAARSTWSPDQAEAAWQAVDDREIYLVSQDLNIQEFGDWADLELHEVYENQTNELQEVVYYFSLPESAVITGVWLGYTPDKSQAFKYQVAPRGAAQAVYREQTRVMRDPALVEQIGPRQYRLRVYPVPRLNVTFDQRTNRSTVEEAPPLNMWLSWREMAAQGIDNPDMWPLPRLAYLRNVYWDENTTRELNGETLKVPGDDWLPAAVRASEQSAPIAHRVDLPGGQTVLALPERHVTTPDLPAGTRLALVIDRSRSMQPHAQAVKDAAARLRAFDTSDSPVDVYLTASPYRGEEPALSTLEAVQTDGIIYYGGQNAAQLIAQYDELRSLNGDRQYDAVLILTDGTGYELGDSAVDVPLPAAPVWLVHLGKELPLGYDDQTLEAIQASGGGVTGNLETALDRIAVSLGAAAGGDAAKAPVVDLVDGYLWTVLPTAQADAAMLPNVDLVSHNPPDPFAALAARRLVLAEMQRNKGSIDQLETLDALHALAMEYGIVTPYSSMIVLVEAAQQQLLDNLADLDDRYQREVESLGDTTPSAPTPLTGVPEPHEWLLMGLAAGMLIYLIYTKRRQSLATIRT